LRGCAAAPTLVAPPGAAHIELASVPFFPQTEYECGPAALATVLANAGLPVDPYGLVSEVYVEGLRGSLQAELLGATPQARPDPLRARAESRDAVRRACRRRPVLVLQNLGVERVPLWHYAVVIGFDRDADLVILRSGAEQRRLERTARFLKSWQRGSFWAFVPIEPGELPATPRHRSTCARSRARNRCCRPRARPTHSRSRCNPGPTTSSCSSPAAGHELGTGDLDGAAVLYRRLLSLAPQHAAARNNLANVLAEQGCYAQALDEAHAALGTVAPDDELYASIRDTVDTLERVGARGDAPQCH
jgi:hypothetical protein